MQAKRVHTRGISYLLGLLSFVAAAPASAETLSLLWDPSPDASVVGYMVYIGTQPGSPASSYDAGQNKSFEWNGAVDGQQYYFSVASYSAGKVLGPRSAEVSRYPNSAPTLNNPGPQSTTKDSAVVLQLSGNDPEGSVLTFGATGLPAGLQLATTTGTITGTASTVGSYTVTATVTDGVLSDSKTFTWAVVLQATDPVAAPTTSTSQTTTQSGHDSHDATTTTTPTTSTNQPPALTDPGAQTATSGTAVALQLSGKDPEGAAVTYGASGLPPGLALGTSTGRISGTVSSAGRYVVTATVSDGALSDAKTFTWNVVEPTVDAVAPVIAITLPTTGHTFTSNAAFVTIGGTAADDGGVVSVNWSTDRGAGGIASGTDNWIAGVPLLPGTNTVTVVARDRAGNVATGSIVVRSSTKVEKPAPSVHLRALDR